jgi:hypothetical protein
MGWVRKILIRADFEVVLKVSSCLIQLIMSRKPIDLKKETEKGSIFGSRKRLFSRKMLFSRKWKKDNFERHMTDTKIYEH